MILKLIPAILSYILIELALNLRKDIYKTIIIVYHLIVVIYYTHYIALQYADPPPQKKNTKILRINYKWQSEDEWKQKRHLYFDKSHCPSSTTADLAHKRGAIQHEEIKQLAQSRLAENDQTPKRFTSVIDRCQIIFFALA